MAKVVAGATALIFVAVLVSFTLTIAREREDRTQASPKGGVHIRAHDTHLFVQKLGRPGSPVVVFIHGTGAWSELWRPYMQQVAALGYEAVALDIPPFGYSVPPASKKYDKQEQASRILGALDSLGVKKAVFVSHSIGSAPLMEALLRAPERVSKLVLIAPALGLDGPTDDGSKSTVRWLFDQAWFGDTVTAAVFMNPLLTEPLVKSFVSKKDKITPEWVALYAKPFSLESYHSHVARWIPELLRPRSTHHLSDDPAAYKRIGFPTFLIWGTDDHITPLAQGERLNALIPASSLLVVPGGHVPMIEEPARVSALLAKALGESR